MGKLYSKKIEGFTVRIEEYASTSDLSHDLDHRQMKTGGWHEPDFSKWTGVKDREQLNDFLKNGYAATVENLKNKVKIKAHGVGKRISFQNNIQGFAPIVPLAMMGVPNNMINMTMKPIKNKVIDVYYDMTCPSRIESEDIITAGEKVLGAIMELEQQGYKFNLYSVQTYCDNRDIDALIVKIKSSDKPFDLKRMSFSLTHTGFFRVVGFDWYGKCPTSKYKNCYGHALGYEIKNKDKMNKFIKGTFGQNALYFRAQQIIEGKKSQEHIKEVLTDAGNNKNQDR